MLLWAAFGAVGSGWSACGGLVGRGGVLWAGAAVVLLRRCSAFMMRLLPADRLMTSADDNDLMPAQEKMEWVTPKISLMDAVDTDGSGKKSSPSEHTSPAYGIWRGPS